MIGLEVLAVVSMGEDHVVVQELVEREVRGVAAVTVDQHVTGLGFQTDQRPHVFGQYPVPNVVEA